MQATTIDRSNSTRWQPNERMRALANAFAENDYAITMSKACELAGIDRTLPYKWMDNPAFSEWWDERRQRRATIALTRVDTAMFQAATGEGKGNPAAAKLLYERFDAGYVPASRTESTSIELHGDIGDLLAAKLLEIQGRPVIDVVPVPVLEVQDVAPVEQTPVEPEPIEPDRVVQSVDDGGWGSGWADKDDDSTDTAAP